MALSGPLFIHLYIFPHIGPCAYADIPANLQMCCPKLQGAILMGRGIRTGGLHQHRCISVMLSLILRGCTWDHFRGESLLLVWRVEVDQARVSCCFWLEGY